MTESRTDKKTQRALAVHANLVRATESMALLLSQQLDSFRMTMSQFRALEALLHLGPLSQTALGKKIFRADSDMNLVTANLQKRGLVVRRGDEEDRRKVMIHLTPQGRELIGKVFPLHAKLVRAQMSALGAREQETLGRLCGKLSYGNSANFARELTTVEAGEART